MDHWIESETRYRRQQLYAHAARAHLLRLAESGRSKSVRGHVADGAQTMSELLASFARTVRGHEA